MRPPAHIRHTGTREENKCVEWLWRVYNTDPTPKQLSKLQEWYASIGGEPRTVASCLTFFKKVWLINNFERGVWSPTPLYFEMKADGRLPTIDDLATMPYVHSRPERDDDEDEDVPSIVLPEEVGE